MAQEFTLAKLVAELGFKYDLNSITKFNTILDKTAERMQSLEKKFASTFGKIDNNLAKQQIAQKRDLDIQTKQVRLEKAKVDLLKAQELLKKRIASNEKVQERSITKAREWVTNQSGSTLGRRVSHVSSGGVGAAFGSLQGHIIGAVGGFGAGYGLSRVNSIVNELNSLEGALLSITGSTSEASKAMSFLKSEGDRLGFSFREAAADYKAILASAAVSPIGVGGGQRIFRGFAEMSTSMGLTGEQKTRAFRSVGQMLSKGKVTAEELNGQLNIAA